MIGVESLMTHVDNIDKATTNFTNKFLSFIHQCIPEKAANIRPNDKPWMDSLLRKTMRVRNRLRKKAQKTRRESDWIIFRRIRNKVNNMKKHAIANYYDNCIDSHLKDASLNNQKLYRKLLKDCFHTKLTHDIPLIWYTMDNDKEGYAFSDTDKIELLNNYFTSI